MAAEGGTKATVAALAANFAIATAKFVAFAFTASASMLAEGIHSVTDTTNQALLLLGMHRARRPATPEHPFGYGRERYFWAFIVAVVLFTAGGVASILEGYEKLRHPHEVSSFAWAIGVLLVAIVFESVSMVVAVREANAVRRTGWVKFIRHAKAPELPVLLLEDGGALLGLFIALTGVTLASVTEEPRYDAAGSLAIGVLLCIIAIVLAVELRSLLIGESASSANIRTIEEAVREDPDVESLIHMRTQHIGPDELLVGIKVHLRNNLPFTKVARVINRIETRVRKRVPAARLMYIEPDVRTKH
ncbi:MAG TPA: cation diffusion facilitator family transporter [Actinomycetota bacterium]|nr:cation diffusion facilitator family transporter [Actinomycetota bacterium]